MHIKSSVILPPYKTVLQVFALSSPNPTRSVLGIATIYEVGIRTAQTAAPTVPMDPNMYLGAQARWHGRGAAQSPTPWARGARYLACSALRVVGARSLVVGKTPTQCRS